ncbi:MAG: homoserine dehydrogenase [Acidobacteria bacterium]|nr:MAG: homoserine dehydrogenase [Acidobacteriota bacterium]
MTGAPKTKKQPGAGRAPRPIGLGIIGVGTVGTGTIKVLQEHRPEIERRLGCRLRLKMICSRSIHKKDLSWINNKPALTTDWKEVVRNPAVDIVVELVGKLPAARAIAFATVDAGKHLVTANKQLVAEHGIELVGRSIKKGVKLGIEACVAGGTPILHAIRSGLAGESFAAVYGILNGTTNYILTEMEQRGASFSEALAEAQKLGFAEPDPTFDVEGFDARYKIAILTMVCFGQAVPVEEIPVEGITRIEQVDFAYAHRLNRTIRLIAAARRQRGRNLEITVRPMMIPQASQLANVWGSTNGILLLGNMGGATTLTGRGAGGEPTGVAVLSDVVEIARTIATGGAGSTPLGYSEWHREKVGLPSGELVSSYLRLVVRDRPGILARVCATLGRHRINIDSVLQEPAMPKENLPFVMTLEPTAEVRVRAAVREIARLPFLVQPPLLLPFVDLP